MYRSTFFVAAAALLPALLPVAAAAAPVRAFVPEKGWAVTIDLSEFEPFAVQMPKTILGGSLGGGITLTLLVEQAEAGTTAVDAREKYGMIYALGAIDNATIQKEESGDMAFISYSKEPDGRPWGFNGYAVKEDVVFDLHVSGTEQALPKEQLAAVMKSLTIEATSEIADTMEWDKRLRSAENEDEYTAALSSFLQKYPQSPWGYWQLAERRFASKDLAKAKDAYLRALKNHRTQPFLNPLLLWQCYDGLGMCYGMMQEYDQSKKYLDLGHELAEELDDAALLAASAYNLACWHAEKGDAGKSAEFLREAVRLAPERADAARKDSSFSRIRETREFRDAITPPSPPER
ncbi:MAG TPA: tetratricopeptide repeat protein [Candidatus Hydrogenedentes bacterium]|nr:tetratricopeptide repeat protein [Candidatus Hydrogenedentota bacterium]